MDDERWFTPPLQVINIGLELFADNLRAEGVEVVHVAWRPPAGGDARLAGVLARLYGDVPEEP
ncbi:MAG TPA: fdrA domain protein [bacterium]